MRKKHDRSSRDGLASDAGIRSLRLEELFREELTYLIDNEITDERLFGVRVTRVELSRDGSRARVWFVPGTDSTATPERVEHALIRATSYIRRQLCDVLPMKRMPTLFFSCDPLFTPDRVKEPSKEPFTGEPSEKVE